MKHGRYIATVHIGIFWKGHDLPLGVYRWLWLAKLHARFYLLNNPYRAVTITQG